MEENIGETGPRTPEKINSVERRKIIDEAKKILIESSVRYGEYLKLDWDSRIARRDSGEHLMGEDLEREFKRVKDCCIVAQQAERSFRKEHPTEDMIIT